jgi:hypothetical protein
MSDTLNSSINIQVTADTTKATESLTALLSSLQKSLDAFNKFPGQAEIAVNTISASFGKVKTSVESALEPLKKLEGMFKSVSENSGIKTSSVKIVDDAQVTKEIGSIRSLVGTIDSAKEKIATLGSGDSLSAFNTKLDLSATKATTLGNYLKNAVTQGSELRTIISAEVGLGVKPNTMSAWATLNQNVRDYISNIIRANSTTNEGANALVNQQKLLNINKGIIDSNISSLSKTDATYSQISTTVSGLLSLHFKLLETETKQFNNEAEISTALAARAGIIKTLGQLQSELAIKQNSSFVNPGDAAKVNELVAQVNQLGLAIRAPISALKSFSDDIKNTASAASDTSLNIKSLSLSLQNYANLKVPEDSLGFKQLMSRLTALRNEINKTSISLDDLAKNPVLSKELKLEVGIQQAGIGILLEQLNTIEQGFIKDADAAKLDVAAKAKLDVANRTVVESGTKLIDVLTKQKEALVKVSEGIIKTDSGTFISSNLAVSRDAVIKSMADIEATALKSSEQINLILKSIGANVSFENLAQLKSVLGNLKIDSSASEGLKVLIQLTEQYSSIQKELALQSKASVFTIPVGSVQQFSQFTRQIRDLDSQFSQLGVNINHVMSGDVPVELFNKMSNAAKNSSMSIRASMVNVETILKQVKDSFGQSLAGGIGMTATFDTSQATSALKSLLTTLTTVKEQIDKLGQNSTMLDPLIDKLTTFTSELSLPIERIKALEEIQNLLKTSSLGVTQVLVSFKEQLSTIFISNSLKELPKQFEDISLQIKGLIQETELLNQISSKSNKKGSYVDYQMELLQLKELNKDSLEASKSVDILIKNLMSIGKTPAGKQQIFTELQNQVNGLKVAFEQKFDVKIDMTNAESAFKTIIEQYILLKDKIQSNTVKIKMDTAQVTEAAKSTSISGDAIFQATGLHNTMRALTEEGSLLSKGIRNYFTSIADGLKIGKASVMDFEKGLVSLEDELVRLRSGVVTWSMGIMMMGQAVFAPFVSAVKGFADFGDTMKMVQAVSESTDAKLQALTETTLQLTSASRFDPKSASEGLLELARAGYSANEAIAALPIVLRMAQAGALAVGESAVITSHLMNTFQLGIEETGKVTDILVKAANESTANVSDLGHAFTYVGALAKGFGVSMEETVGAIGAMANMGFTGCYDDQTEILTRTRGFQLFKDLIPNEEVMTINKDTLVMEWQAIEDQVWRYSLNDSPMFHIKTKSLDLNVTPNHRMFIETYAGIRKIVLAEDFKEGKFFRAGVWEGVANPIFVLPGLEQNRSSHIKVIPDLEVDMVDWVKFLAWYLSEGSLHHDTKGNYRIRITQSKEANPEKCKILEDLFERLPFHFNSDGRINYGCYNQQLYVELEKYGKGFANKIIPQYVKDLPASYLQEFYESYKLGDGDKQGTLYTSGKQLAEDLYEIVVKSGYAAQLKLLYSAGTETFSKSWDRSHVATKDGYAIYVSKHHITPWVSLWRQDKVLETTSNKIGYENYTGFVYCVTVPNSIVLVRRNGKSVFCGNSMAGTALRGMLEHLFNPTKDEAKLMDELGKRIGGVGLQIKDSEGSFIGFANIIRQLEKAGFTSAEALRLFGQRAGPGVAAMMKLGSAGLDEFNSKMYTAEGTAGAMSQMMESSLQGRFELMTRAIQSFSMALAQNLEAPLKMAADAITTVVVAFHNFHTALGPVAQVLDTIAASLAGFMAVAGSATFAWFLMVVPVTQFLGFVRLLVAVMEVGKTSLLTNAAAGQVLAAQQMEQIAVLTGVTIQTKAATIVTELNTIAKIQNNEATIAQGLAEMRTALMAQGLTTAQIEQTMAMTANSIAMARDSEAALLLAKNTAIADLANRGFFATLGAFGKMMLSQLASGLAALGTYVINAVKSIYTLVVAQGVLGTASIGLSGILTYLQAALIRVSVAATTAWTALMGPIGIGIAALALLGAAIYGIYLSMTEVERAKEDALKFDKESESIKKYAGDIKDAKAELKDLLVTRLEGEIETPNIVLDKSNIEKTIQQFAKLEQDALKHGNTDIALEYKFNLETNSQDVALRFKDQLIPIIEAGKALPAGIKQVMDAYDTSAIDSKAEILDKSLKNFGIILTDGVKTQGILITAFHKLFNIPITLDSGQQQKLVEVIDQNKLMFSKWYESQKQTVEDFSNLKTAEVLRKYWIDIYGSSSSIPKTVVEETKSSLTVLVEEIRNTEAKLKNHKPLQVSLVNLAKNSDDFKAGLVEFDNGYDEATKKMADKFKTGFDAAGKYLTEFTAINSEASKDQIRTLESASTERLALAKKDADMTGTFEVLTSQELRKTTTEKTKILIDGLKIIEDVKKSMMDSSQGLGPELKIEAEKGFIEVLGQEKTVYQDSVASMIAESAKLADIINGLEKNYRTFHESILASQVKLTKDACETDLTTESASLEAKKKIDEAKLAFTAGNYADEFKLAQEAKAKLDAIDATTVQSFSTQEKKQIFDQYTEIDKLAKQSADTSIAKHKEEQDALQKAIGETNKVIQSMSVNMSQVGTSIEGSVNKMTEAVNNLLTALAEVAKAKGFDINPATHALTLDDDLKKLQASLRVAEVIRNKLVDITKIFDETGKLTGEQESLEYLKTLDNAFTDLHKASINVFEEFKKEGEDFNLQPATTSLDIFKNKLGENKKAQEDLLIILRTTANEPGISPQMKTGIEAQIAEVEKFKNVITNDLNTLSLLDPSKFDQDKEKFRAILDAIRIDFTKFTEHTYVVNVDVADNLLVAGLDRIKAKLKTVVSTQDLIGYKDELTALLQQSVDQGLNPTLIKSTRTLLNVVKETISTMAGIEPKIGKSPNPTKVNVEKQAQPIDTVENTNKNIVAIKEENDVYTKNRLAIQGSIDTSKQIAGLEIKNTDAVKEETKAVDELSQAQLNNRKIKEDLAKVERGTSTEGNKNYSWMKPVIEQTQIFEDVWNGMTKSVETFSKQDFKIDLDLTDIKNTEDAEDKVKQIEEGLRLVAKAKEEVNGKKMDPENLKAYADRLTDLETAYTDALSKLDKPLTPEVKATSLNETTFSLENMVNMLNSLKSEQVGIPVEVFDKATSVVESIQASVDQLHGKTLDIIVNKVSGNSIGGLISYFTEGGNVFNRPSYSVVPGSGDGDKVPAMLEANEFVLRKSSVQKFGVPFLNNINAGILKLQSGGLVSGFDLNSIQGLNDSSFNKGKDGKILDEVNVNLQVGNHPVPFVMKSNRETANELLAVLKNVGL